VVVPTGPDPENMVGDEDIGSPDRTVSSGLQVSGEQFPSWSGYRTCQHPGSIARMCGTLLLLPLHPFMAWTVRSLTFSF
jgi:hypothetical protein